MDRDNSNLLLAGYGNGFVRLYDLRHNDDRAVVQQYQGHQSWVGFLPGTQTQLSL
jgi:hypothetical protein